MNACPDLLAALRTRERDLETDAAGTRARLEEVRELIAMIEQPQRRRRRRTEPTEPAQHVPGAVHQPQPSSSSDELFPAPQDTQESAQ